MHLLFEVLRDCFYMCNNNLCLMLKKGRSTGLACFGRSPHALFLRRPPSLTQKIIQSLTQPGRKNWEGKTANKFGFIAERLKVCSAVKRMSAVCRFVIPVFSALLLLFLKEEKKGRSTGLACFGRSPHALFLRRPPSLTQKIIQSLTRPGRKNWEGKTANKFGFEAAQTKFALQQNACLQFAGLSSQFFLHFCFFS